MSRTIKFAKAGRPDVLGFIETQVPAPGPNEVRIKVKAIGINRAEAMCRVDDYMEPVKFPAGLGDEAAGIVDAVGKDVGGFAVGDEVNVIPCLSLNDYATYGEVILVPERAVVRQPKALSFTEAASVWMMLVTARGALIEDAKVTKGDFVLITAAAPLRASYETLNPAPPPTRWDRPAQYPSAGVTEGGVQSFRVGTRAPFRAQWIA